MYKLHWLCLHLWSHLHQILVLFCTLNLSLIYKLITTFTYSDHERFSLLAVTCQYNSLLVIKEFEQEMQQCHETRFSCHALSIFGNSDLDHDPTNPKISLHLCLDIYFIIQTIIYPNPPIVCCLKRLAKKTDNIFAYLLMARSWPCGNCIAQCIHLDKPKHAYILLTY